MSELKKVLISLIRPNPVALREVDRTSEGYLGLVESVRTNGIMNPILVRELKDENGQIIYGLIDGLHRFTAAADAGLEEIPAQVTSMDDAKVAEAQIIANVHKVETKPVEYSRQLQKILLQNPLLTVNELATRLSKSSEWLGQRLGLTKLDEKIAAMVDDGTIKLANAFVLAKLPPEEQANFVDSAISMSSAEFAPTVMARVKEIREANRAGKTTGPTEFVPVAHLQKLGDIKSELDSNQIGSQLLPKLGITDAAAAWKMAIQWCLNLDPMSVDAARERDAARKKKLADEKAKRDAERAKKKAEEAAAAAAKAQESLAASGAQ